MTWWMAGRSAVIRPAPRTIFHQMMAPLMQLTVYAVAAATGTHVAFGCSRKQAVVRQQQVLSANNTVAGRTHWNLVVPQQRLADRNTNGELQALAGVVTLELCMNPDDMSLKRRRKRRDGFPLALEFRLH